MTWQEMFTGAAVAPREQPRRAEPSPAELRQSENERVEKRKAIRDRLAVASLNMQRHTDLTIEIESLEGQKDLLAAQHVAACAPLQSELATIENQQLKAIVGRQEGRPDLDTRRKALLHEIREHNAALEAAIESLDKQIGVLKADRAVAGSKSLDITAQNDLIRTARPDLEARMNVARSRNSWATARLTKAREAAQAPDAQPWTATELADAQADSDRTKAEWDATVAAVLNE